ncbi:hypothetical protein A5672_14935 [Mycobacterium alsense]|uniref:Major facilitator superfamily (MFS) profile domain-containing protein n=1 Tax=Mycobacterium alsense TaxID=324058 RepID=A0ABD6P1N8_9MYCO|nr:MFS transporter [Mycobacterium alsense]OBG39386.1 hypothetical protein A5672_14935 [Mycobacterium alsense]
MIPAAAAVFLDYASLMVVMPLLPLWSRHLGATPVLLGALLTTYAAAQLACMPALGALSDRYGRKPVMVTSLALSATSFALIAVADSLPVLFAARIVGGPGASIVGAAHAIVSDRVPTARQARAMGCLGAAVGAAHAVGPALGGALTHFGPSVPMWVAAALSAGNTVITWALLPETRRGSEPDTSRAPTLRWRELLRDRRIRELTAIALILGCVTATLETVLVLFVHRTLGWGQSPIAWLRAYHGAVAIIVQLWIIGRCAARFGERRVALGALAVTGVGLVVLGLGATAVPILLAVGFIAIGTGLISPLLATLFSFASPPSNRGAVLGFAHGLTVVAHLFVPLTAGAAFTWSIGSPFLVAGLSCALGACLLAANSRTLLIPREATNE